MENFRDGLNEIWENKDWDNNSFFEAICELHDKFYEPLNQGQILPIHGVSNLLCGSFDADLTTSSATKCKCGREKWEHPKAT